MSEGLATSPIKQQPMQGNFAPQPDAQVGQEVDVDESTQQAVEVSFEHAPSFWENNIHNKARIEGANTPTDYFMFNQNGDGFAFTGRSTEPEVLQPSIQSNVEKMIESANSDMGNLQIVYNGERIEVPGLSLREIRMNQDSYPDFMVLAMPNPGTNRFSLHVTHKQSGHVLNQDEIALFLQNIVQPALMAREEAGVTEIAS